MTPALLQNSSNWIEFIVLEALMAVFFHTHHYSMQLEQRLHSPA